MTPQPHVWRGLWAAAWLSVVSAITTPAAYGQARPPCERPVLTLVEAAVLLRIDADELERLAGRKELPGRRLGSHWRFGCAAVMAWLAHDAPSPLDATELAEVSGAGAAAGQALTPAPAGAPPQDDPQEKPVGEAPEERPAEDIFLRGQRLLLGRGEVVMDVGQFYSRHDADFLASVDQGIGLATLEQQTFTTLLVGRVGVFSETELFASTTFHSQRSQQFLAGASLGSSRQSQFGGVQLGVRRTLLREGAGRPDIIAMLSGQIPTRDDMPYAAGAGVVLVKSIDPVVLFASGSYSRAFSRESSTVTLPWPRYSVDLAVGYGLALNDTLAISMAVSGVFTGSTTLNDARVRQPDVFAARFGLTTGLTEGLYIEPSVSFGLTGPGRGVGFGVTMPYAF